MSASLRCAVIGAGAFAEACHLPGLRMAPGVEVVALCGRRRERAEALAQRFAVPRVYTDARDLLAREEVDAVAICTPNAAHHEQALLALAAGKHVLCEKPLALTVGEAEEMTAAARRSGRVHLVAFTYRYLHGVAELRRRVRAGDIGEPFLFRAHHEYWDALRPGASIGWRELQAPSGGGVLWDSGSHFFDLARHLVGPVSAVAATTQHLPREAVETASGERRAVETDDLAVAWLRFAERPQARGHWHASRITPPRGDNHVQVVGREGALEALLSRGRLDRLRVVRAGERDWRELPLPPEAAEGRAHALGRMMTAFVEACRRGAPDETDATFADGLAAQRLLAAAERSASEGGWVELAPPA
jgi:predicted dehydrogenase